MYANITIEEALRLDNTLLVDVRSEDEYLNDTIPEAVNVPVLHNEERVAVGITYRKEGEDSAVKLGYRLVTPRLAEKLSAVCDLAAGQPLAVFCWRGGRRSEAMAQFLAQTGLTVYRIIGGYKAYRKHVLDYLNRRDLPLRGIVLHGLTGVGKTYVLERLADKGMPVLDLEGLAQHRGSVYGKIGLPPSPSQKAFESQIVCALKGAVDKGFFLVECESRRVGNLLVPPGIMDFIREGSKVLLYCSMEERVKRIREVYVGNSDENVGALQRATAALLKKLGHSQVEKLDKWLAEKEYDRTISFMLECYYDPLYNYPSAPSADYELCVDTSSVADAVDIVYQFAEANFTRTYGQ